MNGRTYVGFGFGAIQSGLLLYEAFQSGAFSRLVVAEVVPEVVDAIRADGGYWVNVATADGIEQHHVDGVEVYNPTVPEDAQKLVEALAEAQEIGTALPSVDFFTRGDPSVADLLRKAFIRKMKEPDLPHAVVYTAENHNHAAEALDDAIGLGLTKRVQFLNTVVGKMSGVVTDSNQIAEDGLARVTPALNRAFLVEEFNRILIDKIQLPGFQRGIDVFEEKDELLPFEEAKLYGHNAVHALIGYLAYEKGCHTMSEVTAFPSILEAARSAFIDESGAALVKKYAGLDPLFSEKGFRTYAEDLLVRMMNPYLQDQVERVIRDPGRKLGWNDRLIGAMRLVSSQGFSPVHFAEGARAALRVLSLEMLNDIWKQEPTASANEFLEVLAQLAGVRPADQGNEAVGSQRRQRSGCDVRPSHAAHV